LQTARETRRDPEGINWIKEGEQLEERHLAILPAENNGCPSVVEVLDTLLNKEKQGLTK